MITPQLYVTFSTFISKHDRMKLSLSVITFLFLSLNLQAQLTPNFSPKLGVCTSIKNHEIVAEAGFDYIEEGVRRFLIPTKSEEEFEKNLAILKESTIPIIACNGFLPGSLKSTGSDIHHEEILMFAETAFRRAEIAGIKIIVFGSSGSREIPEGFDRYIAHEQFVNLLSRMGPIAEKHNVTVVIEPLRLGECNFINRVDS